MSMSKRISPILVVLGFLTTSTLSFADEQVLRKITVSATAKRNVVPDVAIVNLTIHSQNRDEQAAINATAEKSKSVLESLANDQIDVKSIETVFIATTPIYSGGTLLSDSKLTGYRSIHELEVTVNRIDTVGAVIDHAVKAGASDVSNIQRRISNESKITAELQVEAVQLAREKAELMTHAEGTDMKVGSAIEIIDRILNPDSPGYGGYPPNVARVAPAPAISTGNPFEHFSPGEMLLQTDVTVIFEMKPSK